MQRSPCWLAVLAAAGLTAFGAPVVGDTQLPAENSRARSASGVTLTCEVFCSQTKLRTANARLRWSVDRAALGARGLANLDSAKQMLEVTVFDQGFEKGLSITLPITAATPERPVAALAQGRQPGLRAYQIQIIEVERPAAREAAPDAPTEMGVVIENLEPGMNYTWRLAIESPKGRLLSEAVTCQAPTCPADIIRRHP
jgi:hypothetical protein